MGVRTLLAVPNVSEGRDLAAIEAITAGFDAQLLAVQVGHEAALGLPDVVDPLEPDEVVGGQHGAIVTGPHLTLVRT